jgi:hypothetical protein
MRQEWLALTGRRVCLDLDLPSAAEPRGNSFQRQRFARAIDAGLVRLAGSE